MGPAFVSKENSIKVINSDLIPVTPQTESQSEKMYLMTCACSDVKSACASMQSDQSSCPYQQTIGYS